MLHNEQPSDVLGSVETPSVRRRAVRFHLPRQSSGCVMSASAYSASTHRRPRGIAGRGPHDPVSSPIGSSPTGSGACHGRALLAADPISGRAAGTPGDPLVGTVLAIL